jgi:hypothetical protein
VGRAVNELLHAVVNWWNLLLVVLVLGFCPGFFLRLLVKLYPEGRSTAG